LQQTWWQTRSQSCPSEFVANQFGLQQTSDWQTRQKCVTFVCEAILWASLSSSLLKKCDGGNAPLDKISIIFSDISSCSNGMITLDEIGN
jgi:hypothetical protein